MSSLAPICAYIRGRRTRSDYELFAANNSTLPTYGCIQLNLGLRRDFAWRFVIADINEPIIGADFLSYSGMLVDVQNQRLIDTVTSLATTGDPVTEEFIHVRSIPDNIKYSDLPAKFPEITRPSGTITVPKHSTQHYINTTPCPPVSDKPRRLHPDKLRIAKAKFQKLQRLGIIRPSQSCWSSPLHLVAKKDNTWRPCGDFVH